ncbi:MAG: hypothetical protein H7Y00_04055 [Fimbriimonadaceae bacterium]|nr:hypothetical protein [Chitinophagales bacterium]
MSEFFDQFFFDKAPIYSIIIEDDGRVAYAYLLKNGDIVSDVWLYNQLEAPINSEWKKSDMPFLNPQKFLQDVSILPILDLNEVNIKWINSEFNKLLFADIYIREKFIARLKEGLKPGWSAIVKLDGPLAKIM